MSLNHFGSALKNLELGWPWPRPI